MTDLEELALQIRCPRCKEKGWCRNKGGETETLHASRVHPIYVAYARGYLIGVDDTQAAQAS